MIQRLLSSRKCFEGVKDVPGLSAVLFKCIRSENPMITYVASQAIRAAAKYASPNPGPMDSAWQAKVSAYVASRPAYDLPKPEVAFYARVLARILPAVLISENTKACYVNVIP